MRRAVLALAAAVLLGGPTVIAFFSGGYFDAPRLWATAIAWVLVLVAAVLAPRPLPVSWPGRAALGGLVALTAWTAVSLAWAPVSGPVLDDVQRLLLYVGVLIAAMALLRPRAVVAAVEPALALGTLVVIGYGLAGRLLPGIVEQHRSLRAGARLEQPLTYWNAEGALAAIGLVLCAHLAGDRSRRPAVRALAAAACAPLGAGLYLSYSRGAIAAAALGMIVLLAALPTWPQLSAALTALVAAVVAAATAAAFGGVADLGGSAAARERDGAIVLGLLCATMAAAALATARAAVAERRDGSRVGALPGARRLPLVAAVAGVLALAGVVAGGLAERGNGPARADRQDAGRLTSLQSNRYEYWRLGVRAFGERPLLGTGAGGFRVRWLRDRPIDEGVRDVHSLELEMATELGIPGVLMLALLLGGVAAAARRALRRHAALAGGWCAACAVWLVHATIDWDWQMPAVTLPALILAGALVAAAEEPPAEGHRRDAVPAGAAAPDGARAPARVEAELRAS